MVDFLLLLVPLIIKKAINILVVETSGTGALLVKQGVTIGVIALLIALFRYVWRLLLLGHSRKVEQGLRNRLYGHIQTLSLSFFQKTKTGDLMARAINDINAVRMACGMGLVAMVDGFVLGTAAIGFMMSIDWRLTLISLIPAPVVVILTRMIANQMSARFERVQKSFSDLTEQARESFSGIRVVKAHQREGWEYERMKASGERYVRESMHLARTLALFFPPHDPDHQCGACCRDSSGRTIYHFRNHHAGRFRGLYQLFESAHLAHYGHGVGGQPDPAGIGLHAAHQQHP